MMWDGHDGWGHGGFYGWPMFITMILVAVAVVVLIVYLVRLSSGAAATSGGATLATPITPPPLAESPRDIAKRRYAAGEIDRETYEEVLKNL